MEGIIGKESESILRFFILLENIQVKMDQLMEGNRPPFNGERFLTDRELSGLLKISRRCLQDYRDQGRLPYVQLGGRCCIKRRTLKNYWKVTITGR